MNHRVKGIVGILFLILVSCAIITVNVYFPEKEVKEAYKELEKEGIAADKLARVFAPVGIDIGAITPEEIAVAITAELIAIRRGSKTALPHMKSAKAAEILKQNLTAD